MSDLACSPASRCSRSSPLSVPQRDLADEQDGAPRRPPRRPPRRGRSARSRRRRRRGSASWMARRGVGQVGQADLAGAGRLRPRRGCRRAPRRSASPTRLASTAPSTETPTVPPRLRKKATAELAAPRSLGRHGVLHGEHQVLHGHADADAEHEQEAAEQPPCPSRGRSWTAGRTRRRRAPSRRRGSASTARSG